MEEVVSIISRHMLYLTQVMSAHVPREKLPVSLFYR